MREQVEIDIGPEHLRRPRHDRRSGRRLRAADDALVPARPRRGGRRAAGDDRRDAARLRRRARSGDALARAEELLSSAYVVDLAWLRTTPWRERLAASFDPPDRRRCSAELDSAGDPPPAELDRERAAARRLAGVAAAAGRSRPLRSDNGGPPQATAHGPPGSVEIELDPLEQEAPGLAGVTVVGGPRFSLSLDRGRGGLRAPRSASAGEEREWQVLGASRGEGGILGEGVRQALLRDPTYGPALGGRPGGCLRDARDRDRRRSGARLRARCSSAPSLGGGHVVLTGGSTPRAAYGEFVAAVAERRPRSQRHDLWFGDERCVPPDDERSNYRMIKESLLEPLAGLTEPTFNRIKGELGPDAGRRRLRARAARGRAAAVRPGAARARPDGHLASLFPDQASLSERSRLVVGVSRGRPRAVRAARHADLPGARAGRQVVFLVVRRVEGRRGRGGVRPRRPARPARPVLVPARAGAGAARLTDPAAAARL